MKTASVVIGAGFGDEGKGNVTNMLCKKSDRILSVRHSGGGQAAHTVVNDGSDYVFRHIPVGYGSGHDVFLTEHFIVNPIALVDDIKEAGRIFNTKPRFFVDTNCPVTTIYDMFINHVIEKQRGDGRHGSCGMGINETITRTLAAIIKPSPIGALRGYESRGLFELRVEDLLKGSKHYIRIISDIKNLYVPRRMKELGIVTDNGDGIMDSINNNKMFTDYLDAIEKFLDIITPCDKSIIGMYDDIVFEGSQGLYLDEHHDWFPHVTRARTGIHNALDVMEEKIDTDFYYVTRCYSTRHGAGPFPTEEKHDGGVINQIFDIVDETNIPNEHQGALRLGFLDIDMLVDTINDDINKNLDNIHILSSYHLVVTCIDQIIYDTLMVYLDGTNQILTLREFHTVLNDLLPNFEVLYCASKKGTMYTFEELVMIDEFKKFGE